MTTESTPTVSLHTQQKEEPEQPKVVAETISIQAAAPVVEPPALKASPSGRKSLVKSAQPAPRPSGPSGFQRVVSMARAVIPIAEKLLPLLDGNVATAAANVFVNRPTPKPVDFAPLEQSLEKLKGGQADLRATIATHAVHLDMVAAQVEDLHKSAEALRSDRDTLQEEVRSLRGRLTVVAGVSFALIGLLVLTDVYFILQNLHVLP